MLYNAFKMFVVRLLLISVLLYNTEAIFDDEYGGVVIAEKVNATIPVEEKALTNRTETIDWYPDYDSVTEEDKRPAPGNTTTNWWSYGSDANKRVPWSNETGYEKENNSTKIVRPYIRHRFVEPVTTTRRPYYSNRYDKQDNDKNTTETSYYWYNKTVVDSGTTRRPYHSDRYDGRRNEGVKSSTSRRKYFLPRRYDRWRNRPRDLTTPRPDIYNDGTYDTNHINSTTKPYGYWYGQWWNRPQNLTTHTPYGYNGGTYDTGNYTDTTPKHYGDWYGQWWNRPRNLSTPAPYEYNNGTYDTVNHINTTTKHYGYWYVQWWNRPRNLTPTPYGYNIGTYDTGNFTDTTPKHYGKWYGPWWNRPRNLSTPAPYGYNHGTYDTGHHITTTDKNYNRVASVFPIDNRTNSTDRNVTRSQTSGRNPVNILINSSINANQSRINEPFTDFLKKISGYILPSARYIAPNSNVTNLAVVDGNGNSFFYAYNLVVG